MSRILFIQSAGTQNVLAREIALSPLITIDLVNCDQLIASKMLNVEYELIIIDGEIPHESKTDIENQYRDSYGKAKVICLNAANPTIEVGSFVDARANDYLSNRLQEKRRMINAVAPPPRLSLSENSGKESLLVMHDLEMDTSNFMVTKAGREIPLLPKEFALLEFFMRHPDRTFSSETLLRTIWCLDGHASTNALRSAMRRLRQKLGEFRGNSIIENVHGIGYRMRSQKVNAETHVALTHAAYLPRIR
ncbi:MAG: response regulator transcription factor [Candidatus Obscuribacterales bacterium]|nr:response regulator transcription factor [Candidatus Obscuribacterales bacterium]